MRLIDADKLLLDATKYNIGRMSFGELIKCVNAQPTAYDVEKVVEEIKNVGTKYCTTIHCNDECPDCDHGAIMRAVIEIVRKSGVE